MKHTLTLTRRIGVFAWRVTGEVARATPRDWEIAVLKLVRDHETAEAEDVAAELLDGRLPVARRLLHICERNGLIEGQGRAYRLTPAGVEAAESGRVFVPEEGSWTLWASRDPLLPTPILSVAPWSEPSAFDEVVRNGRGGRDGAGADDRHFERLPGWVTSVQGVPLVPTAGNGEAVRIDSFGKEQQAEPADPEAALRVTLRVRPEGVTCELTGRLDGRDVRVDLPPPELAHPAVWQTLLAGEGLDRQWDAVRAALRVGFGDTTERERATHERALTFTKPQLPDLGVLDETSVEGVPVASASIDDANAWARWHLRQSVEAYATAARFSSWQADALAHFPEFSVSLPDRAELARDVWRVDLGTRPEPAYWQLQAAEDWSL